MWYLDGYHHDSILGDKFPIQSWHHEDLKELMRFAEKVIPLLDHVEISRHTKGKGSYPIREEYYDRLEEIGGDQPLWRGIFRGAAHRVVAPDPRVAPDDKGPARRGSGD
jgi:hypothetical protein